MSEKFTLSLMLDSTDYSIPLGMRICLDHQVVFETSHVDAKIHIKHDIADDDGEHELTFEMFGKKTYHTQIDQTGAILSDVLLSISDVFVDEINIGQLLYSTKSNISYCHDFNSSQSPTEDRFHGFMGCNGTVTWKFTTPIYLWLLENM